MAQTTVTFKCANCGGELKWTPEKVAFECEYCGSVFTEDEVKENAPQEQQKEDIDFEEQTDVYTCKSCGAEIFCDHNTAATFCYYCHNPVSLTGRLTGALRPDKIIPFKLDRESAEKMFRQHCGKKKFLPFDFLSDSTLEKMTGLYVPFWMADVDVDARVTARSVKRISHSRGDRTYVTEKTFSHERGAKLVFKGVPADGSRKIDDDTMDAVEPFNYQELRDFDMSYLSGFFCDKYDVDKLEVLPRISSRVEDAALQYILNDLKTFGSVSVTDKRIRLVNTTWKYMLLPVWFMTYKYNGKIYNFALNGQTAKVAGRYPVSVGKLIGLVAAIMVIVTIAGTMIGGM
ncbi:MAG: hypothetical protein J6F31_08610 [Oscillospiraceae bacterium]|nr:hypothetical protein [Oscillospiraceae bacterium]